MLNDETVLEGTSYRVKKHFYRQAQVEYIFGASNQERLILNQLLQEEAGSGGIIYLNITRSNDFLDVLVAVFTLGIYARSTVRVEGDVILWD